MALSPSAICLPKELLAEIEERGLSSGSYTIALNVHEGRIIAYEITVRRRLGRVTHSASRPEQAAS